MSNFSSTYPSVSPTYQIDFSNGGRIPPNATFSRSDSPIDATKAAASAVHYWSNEKHLSSENLLSYSSDISQSAWTKDGLSETGGQTAPDGGTDAYKLAENSATSYHRIYAALTADGGAITLSAYVKYIGRQWVYVRLNDSTTTRRAWFDVQNGATGTADSQFSSTTITASGNGYYKITATLPNSSTSSSFAVIASAGSDGSYSTFAGLNADAFAVWGIQVSSTGETVLNETSGQIARSYAPTLKSVATAGDARFEYDPTDGQSMGCLLESSSTNLFTYSSDASNADWTKTGTTATAEAIGPDGQLSAFAVRETTAGGVHILRQAVTIGSGSVAFSIYAKLLGNTRRMVLREDSTTGAYATFDLSTGTVAASGAGGSGSLEAVGNGFYRCTMVSSPGAGTKNFSAWVVQSTATTYETYTGDGYSGLLLAMPQIEDQSFASSWISTTSSTATRASDSLSVVSSSLFDNGDTTVMCDVTVPTDSGPASGGVSSRFFRLENSSAPATGENYEVYRNASGQIVAEADAGGANVASYYVATSSPAGNYKLAVRYGSDSKAYLNGAAGTSSDSAMPNPSGLNTLRVGNYSNTAGFLNGHCKRIAVYGEALSDSNLQAITS